MFPIAKSVFVIGMIYVPIVPLTYGIRGGRNDSNISVNKWGL